MPKPVTEARLAARRIAAQKDIPPAERRELLDMLGLLTPKGGVEDNPGFMRDKTSTQTDANRMYGRNSAKGSGDHRVPDSALPPGLRKSPEKEAS